MIQPSFYNSHQGNLINVTEKYRINYFDNFLIHNFCHQLVFILIHQLNQSLLFWLVFLPDRKVHCAEMKYFAEEIRKFVFVLQENRA